ncbi:MAG TPA: SSI family serine proteinase inhibitor [Actinophytocola sp.]|jgi:hypothetical protein|nr:SSI family serine proteinase inhibitor [Actinophytocola sp.]
MTSYRLGGVLLAAATLLSTVLAGSASADRPWSMLTLTVAAPHGAGSTVHLQCHPAGGSHPNPESACRAVGTAHGDFDDLPGSPQFVACTMEYRPVTASARGSWHGRHVRWKHKFANPCTLRADTGVVFDF